LSDPVGIHAARLLTEFGLRGIEQVRTVRLFTIGLGTQVGASEAGLARCIAQRLLTDPVAETCRILSEGEDAPPEPGSTAIEVHFKPGVTDAVGESTLAALHVMGITAASVSTASRFEIHGSLSDADLQRAKKLLGNDCVQDVVVGTRPIRPAPTPASRPLQVRRVELASLKNADLERLSRERHLFLSLDEMRALQAHYGSLGRDPTDLEVETIAQTWSEHCIHKTLRAAIDYRGDCFPVGRPSSGDHEVPPAIVRYGNLLRDTIARATQELTNEGRGPKCLSVFKDNAGVIAFDDQYAIAFKVETHNHPSAIEPYGGSATGIGGVIRDVLGCGLGAKPIANTDIFCVAPPAWPVDAVPKGVIHPRALLKGIVAGVRDYGNRMGIPTVNGAIHFDPRYLGNPLVYCGCVGLLPRNRIDKRARPGDAIVLLGGRTGRDGIHGATFSSAELTDSHEDEFAHAVQIGNPIEEKKVLDIILQAREFPRSRLTDGGSKRAEATVCLYSALTDCGAGGLSSAVGEMAEGLGAEVDLEKVPLKYAGLRYDEIWISEAQERMVLAVPPERLNDLLALAAGEDVDATVIGRFTDSGRLLVRHDGVEVGDLDLHFLHEGLPKTRRIAEWAPRPTLGKNRTGFCEADAANATSAPNACLAELRRRLASPTTASKHWVIRQYDHEVQGGSVIKPLAGVHDGPSDAAVLRPRLDSNRGIALGCGLAPQLADFDPYWMAVAAIDEAIRNVVCAGGDPDETALLDNFCWPRVDDPRNLGALVRACQACYDAAKAYGTPFISGKDSLNNEFALDPADTERVREQIRAFGDLPEAADPLPAGRLAIPYTLLISAIALVEDVRRCVTVDLKQEQSQLYLVGQPATFDGGLPTTRPLFDMKLAAETHRLVAKLIREGLAVAVHDVSEGGPLTACAEMCLASDRSCRVHGYYDWAFDDATDSGSPRLVAPKGESERQFYFGESPGLYLVEASRDRQAEFEELVRSVPSLLFATVGERPAGGGSVFQFETNSGLATIFAAELRNTWRRPLDW
jgi:phosphoribosylformylglycinamidine synthase